MSTIRFITVYALTNMDKASIRRAATKYVPVMSVTAAYWLLMLEAYTVRDGDLVLLKLSGSRPSIEQFALLVGHHFHLAERAPPKKRPRRKYRSDRPGGFTAEDLLRDTPAVQPIAERCQRMSRIDHEPRPLDCIPLKPSSRSS